MRTSSIFALVGAIALIAGCSGGSKNDSGPIPVTSSTPVAVTTSAAPSTTPSAVVSTGPTASPKSSPTSIASTSPTATPTASAMASQNPGTVSIQNAASVCNVTTMSNGTNVSGDNISCANSVTQNGYTFAASLNLVNASSSGSTPTYQTQNYLGTQPDFVASPNGSVIASEASTLNDTPATITFVSGATVYGVELIFNFTEPSGKNLSPGDAFDCALYDGDTFINVGSGTATSSGSNVEAECIATSSGNAFTNTNSNAASIYYGDTTQGLQYTPGNAYTLIISTDSGSDSRVRHMQKKYVTTHRLSTTASAS